MANYSEIQLNNKTLLSTAEDTVTSQSLEKGTTATNSAGEKVEGEAEIITRDEINILEERVDDLEERTSEILGTVDNMLYSTDDEESSEIDNEDYIPFYDNSEQEKKNTLLSTIINKIKSAFLSKTWGHVELIQNSETLRIKDTQVDASASDNGVTAIHYPSSNDIVDNDNRIVARYEAVVNPNGYIGAKMYARNYDANGNSVGMNTIEAGVDKSGNYSYNITDPDKFRKTIKTIDQEGTKISANSDLDDYTTAGTYYVENNTDAGTISNMPLGVAYSGKLIVMSTDTNVRVTQLYISNYNGTGDLVHMYARQIDNNGVAKPWREFASTDNISPANIGNGFGICTTEEATVTKEVTLSGYNLTINGYVSVKFTYAVPANATLNINSQGAKNIWYRGANITANVIQAGDLATFIYDGTRYQLVGVDRDSTAQKYYVNRDEVAWSDVLGTNYNTTSWYCHINRSGNILIGSMELATSQGSTSITFPAYSQTTTNVFCRFTYKQLTGYIECIVNIGNNFYPAFITNNTIDGTNYTAIALRKDVTITKNENIRVSFFAMLETT